VRQPVRQVGPSHAEYHERLRAEDAIERLQDFDVEEAIRAGRDDRDEQRYGRVR
jgi:hypothetical protein